MKSIDNFSGYGITSCGKIWSYKRNRFLKQRYDKDGYLKVGLVNDDGKQVTFQVHRLVAMAYIPNPDGKETVNHTDEVKDHNWVGNLSWMTRQENLNYGTRTERQAKSISKPVRCVETGEIYQNAIVASNAIGVDVSSIYLCVRGKQKTSRGYHWEWVK